MPRRTRISVKSPRVLAMYPRSRLEDLGGREPFSPFFPPTMLQKIDRRDLSGTYAKRLNRYCLFKIRDARLLFKSEAESSDRFGVSLLNRFGMSLLIWTWRGIYVRAVFPLPHQGEGKNLLGG